MPRFRYDTAGTWYKGNTHVHSTVSDGGKTFGELARMYSGAGYDFLFRTDHWTASHVAADTDHYPLLWLDGIELGGEDSRGSSYHVVCLGTFDGITKEMGFARALHAAHSQDGILILAHPHWTGISFEDALRYPFHGVEVFNNACQWLNGKGEGSVCWNWMLQHSPSTLAFAADDAHIKPQNPGWNQAWIMVNASELSPESLRASIRAGNFYSTCGPEFLSIDCHETAVTVTTSPVSFIRLAGTRSLGRRIGSYKGELFTTASFIVPPEWTYAYVELEDARGRRAWTNTLFAPAP